MQNFKRTKLACYTAYFTMSSIFVLPPLLFVTFHEMYGISYTLLGTLVLTNFCTQLGVDLVFTLFTKYFNVAKVVRIMPIITTLGLVIYAAFPMLFPDHAYGGLLLGTVIFSVSAGLSEALLSPVIAAIPSETPGKDMSLLHSLYAFGVFFVVMVSTLFLKLFGNENWMYLTFFVATFPLLAALLFAISPMPEMELGNKKKDGARKSGRRALGLALCVGCIFFGSCAENTMSNWLSGYLETALGVDKALGDILGMAMFAILLGIARISYAGLGGNINKVLMIGMIGSAVCYITVGISSNVIVAFLGCILTGLCIAMLWPGSLIMMEERIPGASVAAFALMAAGGDLGASVAPQLMGIVVDKVSVSQFSIALSEKSGMSCDQIGMKVGMLVSSTFPIIGVILLVVTLRFFRKNKID